MDKGIKVQVIGVKPVDWTNPDNGIRYQSTKLWVIAASNDENTIGNVTQELRLPADKFDKFKNKTFPVSGTLVLGDFNLSKGTFKCIDIII